MFAALNRVRELTQRRRAFSGIPPVRIKVVHGCIGGASCLLLSETTCMGTRVTDHPERSAQRGDLP